MICVPFAFSSKSCVCLETQVSSARALNDHSTLEMFFGMLTTPRQSRRARPSGAIRPRALCSCCGVAMSRQRRDKVGFIACWTIAIRTVRPLYRPDTPLLITGNRQD